MAKPYPIKVTSATTTNTPGTAPEPFLLVIPGYNPAVAQRLEHDDSGVIHWVDAA